MRLRYSVLSTIFTEPIQGGEVTVGGVELEVHRPQSIDANSREVAQGRYDVGEMSIATFLSAVERGAPLLALPVFTSGRRFLQCGLRVSERVQPDDLSALKGSSVGAVRYWMSSCIWQRIVLQEMHGLMPQDLAWVTIKPEGSDAMAAPRDVDCRRDETGRPLAELVAAGEIDACLTPGAGPHAPGLDDVTVPAYRDGIAAEREFYRQCGVFPLQHVTAIQREFASDHPEVVTALLDAYGRAKRLVGAPQSGQEWPLPRSGHQSVDQLWELLGGDPWPYGISSNRATLEFFLEHAVEQGLLGRQPQLSELFVADLPAEFQ